MRGSPTTFWGKLQQDEAKQVVAWHPLLAHCADVAACAEALLQRTLLRRRLATLGGKPDLTDVDIARLSALAALHDIGKFNRGFQRKADSEPKNTAGHVAEVLCLFGSDYSVASRLFEVLPCGDLELWADDQNAFRLLTASIGHHGRPVAWGHESGISRIDSDLWSSAGGLDPFAGIASLVDATRAWFPSAFTSKSVLPSSAPFQHAFAGLVMLADWLGSDRHDHMFPFAEDVGDRMPFARERARLSVEGIGLEVHRYRSALGLAPPEFNQVSEHPPREAQSKTISLPSPTAGSLSILESETGSGKTEASLIRFARLFHAGAVDGLTFALPTRTAATQLHARVVEAVRRLFPEEATRPAVVLAVPGYLQFDTVTGSRLPGFEVLWNDDPKAGARHRGWPAEQPKRFLAGCVVVGTIDQVLLSSLRVGHAHLRATALLRHLLVVDEVHASDAYMTPILEEVLAFHLAGGGHAFLMSATLGTHVRRRLEAAALGITHELGLLAEALEAPYPAIHQSEKAGERSTVDVKTPGLPKDVQVDLLHEADHEDALATRALSMARMGARVLVIRNTVTDAVATQQALERLLVASDADLVFAVRGVKALHHSRFARPDRLLLDAAIEERFGKQAPRHRGALVIATQTVQQSLDLDADVLFTDLAPMDVLLQRLGRLHRHRERDPYRPSGFGLARAFILIGDEPLDAHLRGRHEARGPHGFGSVYDNLAVLEATRRVLVSSGQLHIPLDNRRLVELTTHPEALESLCAQLGPDWTEHLEGVWGRTFSQQGLAALNIVDRRKKFGDFVFREHGLTERIASRLGESDRRVRFDSKQPRGPFGERVRELSIPGWLARDIPGDPELLPTRVTESEGARGPNVRFVFGEVPFIYDRFGLRRDTEPHEEDDIADA